MQVLRALFLVRPKATKAGDRKAYKKTWPLTLTVIKKNELLNIGFHSLNVSVTVTLSLSEQPGGCFVRSIRQSLGYRGTRQDECHAYKPGKNKDLPKPPLRRFVPSPGEIRLAINTNKWDVRTDGHTVTEEKDLPCPAKKYVEIFGLTCIFFFFERGE